MADSTPKPKSINHIVGVSMMAFGAALVLICGLMFARTFFVPKADTGRSTWTASTPETTNTAAAAGSQSDTAQK
jgi:hypothetical protein